MAIKQLTKRAYSQCEITRVLEFIDAAVRYPLKRQANRALDGGSQQRHLAERWAEAVGLRLEGVGGTKPVRLQQHRVGQHCYPLRLRSRPYQIKRSFCCQKLCDVKNFPPSPDPISGEYKKRCDPVPQGP